MASFFTVVGAGVATAEILVHDASRGETIIAALTRCFECPGNDYDKLWAGMGPKAFQDFLQLTSIGGKGLMVAQSAGLWLMVNLTGRKVSELTHGEIECASSLGNILGGRDNRTG
jgi:hypothetical protein